MCIWKMKKKAMNDMQPLKLKGMHVEFTLHGKNAIFSSN